MSKKNNNYYPLDVFKSFPKYKFSQDDNMNNSMINKKGMFLPKKFDIFTFVTLSLCSYFLAVVISGLSFFIISHFSYNDAAASAIFYSFMGYVAIILSVFSLYFSFVLSSNGPRKRDCSLYFLVKKKNTSYFGQEEYDLVEKHCPEELDKWVSAIIDYGESTSHEAKTYADNIVKISQKRKDKAEKEKNRNIDEQWIHDRILSDALLDFE